MDVAAGNDFSFDENFAVFDFYGDIFRGDQLANGARLPVIWCIARQDRRAF